jgi:hypothetical protein
MKLKQYKDYRWKHSEYLQELKNKEIEETMKRQGFDAQQINEAITTGTFKLPEKPYEEPAALASEPDTPIDDYFARVSGAP